MRIRLLLTVLALLAATAGLYVSTLDHAWVKALLDAHSADGDVESYTAAMHARVQWNARVLAVLAAVVALGSVLARRRFDAWSERLGTAARSFTSDLRAHLARLRRSHARAGWLMVGIILCTGAAFRLWRMNDPVIYDEAFTCTYYAVRPWYIVVSDYSYPNNHILHTLLVKCALGLFGWGEVQARLPAFIAGVVALVLFWCWVRAEFGDHAALPALVLAAIATPLVEYSALARGYSLTWCALLLSLLLARHLARTRNPFTALLLALVNALGCWAVPTMIYGTAAVFVWLLWRSIGAEQWSLSLRSWLFSGMLFAGFTLLLYAPVLVVYGGDQLLYDETMGPRSWSHFASTFSDRSWEVVSSLQAGSAVLWLPVLALFVGAALIVSRSYRMLLLSLLIAIIPLVLWQHLLGPPRIWAFLLFFILPAPGVALEWVIRSPIASSIPRPMEVLFVIAIALAIIATPRGWRSEINHFAGARDAAQWFTKELRPTDRVLVNVPCEAPLEFYFRKEGLGIEPLYRKPLPGDRLWFVIGKDYGHTFDDLARRAQLPNGWWNDPRPVRDLDGIAIFAAQFGR